MTMMTAMMMAITMSTATKTTMEKDGLEHYNHNNHRQENHSTQQQEKKEKEKKKIRRKKDHRHPTSDNNRLGNNNNINKDLITATTTTTTTTEEEESQRRRRQWDTGTCTSSYDDCCCDFCSAQSQSKSPSSPSNKTTRNRRKRRRRISSSRRKCSERRICDVISMVTNDNDEDDPVSFLEEDDVDVSGVIQDQQDGINNTFSSRQLVKKALTTMILLCIYWYCGCFGTFCPSISPVAAFSSCSSPWSSSILSKRIPTQHCRHLQKFNREQNNRIPLSAATETTRESDEDKDKENHSQDQDHRHPSSLLRHVAIICDGNARWAQQRGLPTQIGHMKGADRLVELIEHLAKQVQVAQKSSSSNADADATTVQQVNVEHCTLYGFSTENWSRPQHEIDDIFKVMEFTASRMLQDDKGPMSSWLKSNNIKLQIIGNWNNDERIPPSLKQKFQRLIEESHEQQHDQQQENHDQRCLTVHLAINYGGRSDIVEATKQIVADSLSGKSDCSVDDIDESLVRKYLSTSSSNIPDPDMIIRTSGEYRLSNFLLFESAYSELYFTETLWPDFDLQAWDEAVSWFRTRQRRFGSRKATTKDQKKNKKEQNKKETENENILHY